MFCLLDVLAIEVPIVCGPFGPCDKVDLAAAVRDAEGLGSLGTAVRPPAELRVHGDRLCARTDRSFAIVAARDVVDRQPAGRWGGMT
jgi:enoyl-[acyl-carrier protein] reductase II